MQKKTVYTYFISDGDAIKIGSSQDAKWRMGSLQVGNPRPLIVLRAVVDRVISEEAAHQKFEHIRIQGEWFQATPELLAFIDALPDEPAPPKPERAPREPRPGISLEIYQQHRSFINQRNACADPLRREQFNVLIEHLEEHDRALIDRKSLHAEAMAKHLALMEQTTGQVML